jgi:hypothetical protein
MGTMLVDMLQDDIVPPPQLASAKLKIVSVETAVTLKRKLNAAIGDLLMLHLFDCMRKSGLGLLCAFVLTAAGATAQDNLPFTARGNLVRVPTQSVMQPARLFLAYTPSISLSRMMAYRKRFTSTKLPSSNPSR